MKFIITGLHASGKQQIVNTLKSINNDAHEGKLFANIDTPLDPKIYNCKIYNIYQTKEINQIFENKAYIFLHELQSTSHIKSYSYYEGLTSYDWDNNNVFVLSPDQIVDLRIANKKDDICFIWVDNTKTDRMNRYNNEQRCYNFTDRDKIEKNDIDIFCKNIYSYSHSSLLYFTDEEPDRIAVIISSIISHPDLLDNYKKYFN